LNLGRSRIWNPRSGIRKKIIPDPESGTRILGVKRHRIPDPDPQHCMEVKNTEDFSLLLGLGDPSVGWQPGRYP
jgi:hypothetical protein